jgi:hypothetical protein
MGYYLSQGEEHEGHDKGSRPGDPPAARKCGHNTPDEQRGEGAQQPVTVEGWGRPYQRHLGRSHERGQ